MMDNFAFIIHPIEPRKDVARKFKLFGYLPTSIIDYFCLFFPPVYISHITGIRSITGHDIEGWLVACPLTPNRMTQVPTEVAYRKIVQTGRLAEKLGAKILGLGAFTSVIGDAGITISKRLSIPVTTGNSYTVAVAVEAVREAARQMEIALSEARAAIVGATGAVGSVCAQLLAQDVAEMVLVGKHLPRLEEVKAHVQAMAGAHVSLATEIEAIKKADLIITVTSAIETIIEPRHLKPGAVVLDVARPRDISRQVVEERNDVLVIEGGMVEVPGPVDFGFDFGFPLKMAYACMAEVMILALEGRCESYTLGRDITVEQVEEIASLAAKHGFKLGGFRSFEHAMTGEEVEVIKENAHRKMRH
jgi:fatty aldehyde-generating acyl-ACP reductase